MGAPTIGRFVIVRELGRGAMGLVLQAWDPRLSRHVALKLPDLANAGPQGLARFEREASAAGRLRHPGIVSVLEVGEDQGRPFLVMDLIEGESFEALLRRERLPARRAVELVLEVTRAVAHAHGQGVVHRDIKPANVLLDREGHAHLADFGLARAGAASDLTRTGAFMGTPECMAPEQAGDSAKRHGPPSDVYALGATLYRALVGRPPITADNLQAFFKKLFEELPAPPRAIDPTIDPALDAVVMRCLQKEPAARFADAGVLARALDAWLATPLAAPRAPRGLGLLLGALVLAVGAAAAVVGLVVRSAGAPAAAPIDVVPATDVAVTPPVSPPTPPPPDPTASLPRAARPLARSPGGVLHLKRVLGAYAGKHPDPIDAIAVSDDERLVLSGTGFWTNTDPGMLQLRELATGEELQAWRAHESTVVGLAFCRDGERAVSCGFDGAVRLWDLVNPTAPLHSVRTPGRGHGLARLAGEPERVVVVDDAGWITSFDVQARTLVAGPRVQVVGPCTAVAALPDGRVFVACNDQPEFLLDAATGVMQVLPGDSTAVDELDVSPDGRFAAATTHTDELWCWDLQTPGVVAHESTRPTRYRGLAWHADSQRLILGGFDGTVTLRRPDPSSTRTLLAKVLGGVWQCTPVGRGRVLIGTDDRAWRLFDVDAQRELTPLPADPVYTIGSLAISGDGGRVVVGCLEGWDRGTTHVFDLTTGERIASLRTGLEWVKGVGLGPRGTRALACSTNGDGARNVQLWDVASQKVVLDFAAPYHVRLSAAAQSPDGQLAVTAGEDGRAHVWDLETGALAMELGPPAGWITSVAFCPQDPRRVVTLADGRPGAIGPTLRGWDLNTAVETKVDLPATPRAGACFSTPSQVLIGFDGPVERWSLLTGERVTEYRGHTMAVTGVAVSPDGRRVLSCALDGFVRLSDTISGEEVDSLDLGLSGDWPVQVAFRSNERFLIATARGVLLDVEVLP